MKTPFLLLSLVLLLLAALPCSTRAEGGSRYLVLDRRVIESTERVALRVGTVRKGPSNPLFGEDRPWEVRFDNLYPNVVFDPARQLYRCWYSPFIVDPIVTETPPAARTTQRYRPHGREMGICYAESHDGLHWEKPALGLVEFQGSTANNLVLRGPHGAGISFDPHDADALRRYKLFCHLEGPNKMGVAFSPDGLHWSQPIGCPEIQVPGDTHNHALWDAETGRYVGFTRLKTDQRLVARTESTDFIHWSKATEVLRGTPRQQTYAMSVVRHAGVYLGLVMIFDTASDRVNCELAWSPDTVDWERLDAGHPLIANAEERGAYDWGCVYAAEPLFLEHEIRLYYGASNGPHTGWRDGFFALATLRPDGFAGYETIAPETSGFVTTNPILCDGRRLLVCADAAHGKLRAAVLDDHEKQFDGSVPITTDVTDEEARWSAGPDFTPYVGKMIRLRFELTNAKLYSFSFAN